MAGRVGANRKKGTHKCMDALLENRLREWVRGFASQEGGSGEFEHGLLLFAPVLPSLNHDRSLSLYSEFFFPVCSTCSFHLSFHDVSVWKNLVDFKIKKRTKYDVIWYD